MEITTITRPLMILVAGPYRSGTQDEPELIAQNFTLMNSVALKIHELGHLPVLAEWLALPLIQTAGSNHLGDDVFNRIFNPVTAQIIDFCSAVLRVGGPSVGADEIMKMAREKHKLIFRNISEIPPLFTFSQ